MQKNRKAQALPESAGEKEIFQYFAPDQARRYESDTTLSALAQLVALRLNATRALISLIDRTNQYVLVEATQNSPLRSDWPHEAEDDGLLFGRKTLARSLGLCGNALDILSEHVSSPPSPSSPLVVDDITQDKRFKNLPFVASHPSVRFYAAMPISANSGSKVGTIAVMDESPRNGLGDDEIQFLKDVELAVVIHLEMTKSQEGHMRSDKMIKGLGVFMEGRTDLHDWWLELGNKKPASGQRDDSTEVENEDKTGLDSTSVSRGPKSPSESPVAHPGPSKPPPTGSKPVFPIIDRPLVATPLEYAATAAATTQRPGPVSRPFPEPIKRPSEAPLEATTRAHVEIPPLSRGSSSKIFTPDFTESFISERLKEMVRRASQIIQESIEADGALFLDARVSTLSERSDSTTSTEGEESSLHSTSDDTTPSSGRNSASNDDAGRPLEDKKSAKFRDGSEELTCRILGLWTSENSNLHGDCASELIPLTESFLQNLLHKYPQGHIFNSDRLGTLHKKEKRHPKKSTEDAEANTLGKMLPGTRSIAFVPLWDQSGTWFAGVFIWTVLPTDRVLTRTGDLNYLAAFGNSIMAEVARLNVVGADRAKSDFISSISHELRSPLHGILASAELLHDTTVDLFQYSLIDTIERCGRTLLDTIQHVLDFAKINNFPRSKTVHGRGAEGKPRGRLSVSGIPSLSVDIDLSLLAEDVVDSVFAGHEFQANSSLIVTDEASGFPTEGLRRNDAVDREGYRVRGEQGPKKERIEVVLDIRWRPNWIFRTESGALRRVLMNLFGNALKYTDKGYVKVSLQADDAEPVPGQPAKSNMRISVSDTGRGISQEYLHNGLFTPFTQENPLNPGTGLGLSIVLQIVRSLGGQIRITSEQGVGTEVVVTLSMNQTTLSDPLYRAREGQEAVQGARDKTKGLTIGLVGLDINPGNPTTRPGDLQAGADPSLFLKSSIESAVTEWFGMKVTAPSTWQSTPPDIYVANENPGIQGVVAGIPTIVLCSHEEMYREYGRRRAQGGRGINDELVHFVSKPCGPHKLAKAFAFCLGKKPQSLQTVSSPGPPSAAFNFSSPQSLFQRSPEDHVYWMENRSRNDYFTPVAETKAVVSSPRLATSPRPVEDDTSADKQKPKLLLVEDNEINLRLLSTFVGRSNYAFDTAVNGLEALQAFQVASKPYDIVIMDITMPVMNGMEATREIRKLEYARRQRPAMIIALTGLGSATSQKEAFDSGINMFLTKPVRLKDMRKILDDWVPAVTTGGGSSA